MVRPVKKVPPASRVPKTDESCTGNHEGGPVVLNILLDILSSRLQATEAYLDSRALISLPICNALHHRQVWRAAGEAVSYQLLPCAQCHHKCIADREKVTKYLRKALILNLTTTEKECQSD